ncbi:hypothetical protein SAMN06272735_1479 [Streptomyces sp. TLI_55]|uniref:hypothetical protein n=1 Tax=Streptomyces sp. TLI_55 TaxID=1938861 RepID=UPI000BDA7561|nr:hypothetical protein [Streptomyces sp. TLI_55]SNX57021.1 hypothetical protein SAMN06272735_1479 [Streptomyces sp. TLI_55]
MNTQYGDVYNYNAGAQFLATPPVTPRRVAEDQLIALQRQFARPPGINAAFDVLRREHTVIVEGAPGTGRSAAAQVLLCELPRDHGTYHELTPEKPESGSGRWLALDLIGSQDRMLLDLSRADAETWHAVQAELSDFRHELISKRAFLAIVLPHAAMDPLSSHFAHLRKEIGRPDAVEALTRHLRLLGVDEWVRRDTPQALQTYLNTDPSMLELARLAERIASLRGPGDFASWCEQALSAQTDRADEVALLVPRLEEGRERALLLASALLHRARSEAVYRGTNELVKVAGSAHDERPLLEHRGLSDRLQAANARLGPDGRVHFPSPGFAEAARHYFWTDLPDVRDLLSKWIRTAVRLRELDPADRGALVERFTDLCVQTGEFGRLDELVRAWTSESARPSEVQAAAHLLKRGVENERSGGEFRAMIYGWSTSHITASLRAVLAEVCEKVMSVHHPEPALVRLHHLARLESPPGVARDALLRYVDGDRRLQRRLLARLATTQSSRHHRADADLFLSLPTLPSDFLLTPATREWLTLCWRSAFSLTASEQWAACAARWLSTADEATAPALIDATVTVLVDASDLRYPILTRIYAEARRAVSPRLAALLLDTITAAQRKHFDQRPPDLEVTSS